VNLVLPLLMTKDDGMNLTQHVTTTRGTLRGHVSSCCWHLHLLSRTWGGLIRRAAGDNPWKYVAQDGSTSAKQGQNKLRVGNRGMRDTTLQTRTDDKGSAGRGTKSELEGFAAMADIWRLLKSE